MSLFSKENREAFLSPLWMNNPVTMQVLGICSALAVTVKLEPALVMGLSVTIIVAVANLVVSLLRNTIPNRIRIIVQLVVVAALVTIVSEVLKAFGAHIFFDDQTTHTEPASKVVPAARVPYKE